MRTVWQSVRVLFVLSVLTGFVYPVAMTIITGVLFPNKADGSLLLREGRQIGSDLVGQQFTADRYFWSRPSAVGYNPLPSSGTNLGPTSRVLRDSIAARAARFGVPVPDVPADLLEASGSGLDPHISPEAAMFQIDRVLAARGGDSTRHDDLVRLVETHLEGPQFGLFGERRVNVLRLNLALDSLIPRM